MIDNLPKDLQDTYDKCERNLGQVAFCGWELKQLIERIAELDKETACPCCKKGINIEGEPCQECHGSGKMCVAYETARVHEKLTDEKNTDLQTEVGQLKIALDTVRVGIANNRDSREEILSIAESALDVAKHLEEKFEARDWATFHLGEDI